MAWPRSSVRVRYELEEAGPTEFDVLPMAQLDPLAPALHSMTRQTMRRLTSDDMNHSRHLLLTVIFTTTCPIGGLVRNAIAGSPSNGLVGTLHAYGHGCCASS
jgi:hypothetical protein